MVILFDEVGKFSSSNAKSIWVTLKLLVEGVEISTFAGVVIFLTVVFQDFMLLNQEKTTSIMDKFLLRVHPGSRAVVAS